MKRLAVLVGIILLVACGSAFTDPSPEFARSLFRVDSLDLRPALDSLKYGDEGLLAATCFNQHGDIIRCAGGVTWTVRDTLTVLPMLTKDTIGHVFPRDTGATYIVATAGAGRAKDSTRVVVTSGPPAPITPTPLPTPILASITLAPSSASLLTTADQQFAATARSRTGTVMSVVIAWAQTGGSIDGTGLYTAGAVAGTYRVIASSGGFADTAAVTVIEPAACTPTTTVICPGDDWQAKVLAAANGTTFTVGAGTHWNQQVAPKSNDLFRGVAGAIMDGGSLLTGWTSSGGTWYVTGQTQQGSVVASSCQTGHPGCVYPEQLWIDGAIKEHVTSLAAVSASTWYFDYTADRIYIGTDPSGHAVVTSVTPYAFGGTATGVRIVGLTMQHYASARPYAVVNGATSWTIDSNTVQDNAGQGIGISTSGKMRWNVVQRQGQMGYKAQGTSGLIYGNTFAFNNTSGFGMGAAGEAGCGKATRTNGLVFRRNTCDNNDGPGPWYDIDNQNGVIDSNTVTNNAWRGIFYEISYTGEIAYNTVTGNGRDPGAGACDGAGILVSSSSSVEVHHNTLSGNRNGLCYQETDRPAGPLGAHNLVDVSSHDNTVTQTDGGRAAGVTDTDPSADPYSVGANNVWANNTYHRTLGTTKWRWTGNTDVSEATWRAAQDAGSTFGP